jgi:hypothetical protein
MVRVTSKQTPFLEGRKDVPAQNTGKEAFVSYSAEGMR